MKLSSAARHFDKQVFCDPYADNAPVFKGQVSLYDDNTRDGVTTSRRILSTYPSVELPFRKVISYDGLTWIVGAQAPDYFGDSAIRRKYVLHRADGLATIKTIQQALEGTPGFEAYVGIAWIKGSKEVDVSSGIFDIMNAYFASTEPIVNLDLINVNTKWYLVRTTYISSAGFHVADIDELADPVFETTTFADRTYDPITDTFSQVPLTVTIMRLRWQSNFAYLSQSTKDYERGDLRAMLPKSVSPAAADTVTLSDGVWRILAVDDQVGYWGLHLRRA